MNNETGRCILQAGSFRHLLSFEWKGFSKKNSPKFVSTCAFFFFSFLDVSCFVPFQVLFRFWSKSCFFFMDILHKAVGEVRCNTKHSCLSSPRHVYLVEQLLICILKSGTSMTVKWFCAEVSHLLRKAKNHVVIFGSQQGKTPEEQHRSNLILMTDVSLPFILCCLRKTECSTRDCGLSGALPTRMRNSRKFLHLHPHFVQDFCHTGILITGFPKWASTESGHNLVGRFPIEWSYSFAMISISIGNSS